VRSGWSGRPANRSQNAKDLGINSGTLGNGINLDRRRREGGNGRLSEDERAKLVRLREDVPTWRWSVSSNARSPSGCYPERDNTHYAEHRIMPSAVVYGLRGKGFVHAASE